MNVQNLTNEEKLNEIFKMIEENNKILRSLRRQQYVSNAFRAVYWLLIIVSISFAYFYIKPLFMTMTGGSSSSFSDMLNQLNSLKSQLPDLKILQEMLQSTKAP